MAYLHSYRTVTKASILNYFLLHQVKFNLLFKFLAHIHTKKEKLKKKVY